MDNAEREPPRCPCGFWGSPQTMNLCSKCYKDELRRRQRDEKVTVTASNGVSSNTLSMSHALLTSNAETSSMENCSNTKVNVSFNQTSGDTSATVADNEEGSRDTKCNEETDGASTSSFISKALPDDRPVQKNKKRCWSCKAKLELAQRELGQCKCEYVFCQLHRLPEQHGCIYDHKESGRREARQKMVTLGPRKVGRSFQRLDE